MSFTDAKADLIQLLGDEANGQYQVIGYKPSGISADTVLNTDKKVLVFFRRAQIDKGLNTEIDDLLQGSHFVILLQVAKKASIDLSVLEDPLSSAAQRATAIDNSLFAELLVNDAMDDFYKIILKIIMKPEHRWFNGTEDTVEDRWVESFEKSDVVPMGEYAMQRGEMILTFKNIEELESVTGESLDVVEGSISLTTNEDEQDDYTVTDFKEELNE